MSSSSKSPPPSPPPAGKDKMTSAQAKSLDAMRSCLKCHLCDKRITDPATLMACMHSFCYPCILKYTEDKWICPVEGCGQSVSCKGGSREYLKKNTIIRDVGNSLKNIEQHLASGPDNWWAGQGKDEGQKGAVTFDEEEEEEEEEEVVDFQKIMDKNESKRKREESDSDSNKDEEDDDATEHFDIGEKGRKTLSIDQSLFSKDGGSANMKRAAAQPPEFSCSPIAMQSSQPDFEPSDEDGRQTATASQLDRVLMPSCQKESDMKALAANCANVQLEVAPSKQSPPQKKQRTSTTRLSDQSSVAAGKKLSPKRVSFQQQPRVLLLEPSWRLSNEHTRCLRKCANDGFISMLKMPSDDAFGDVDEFDSGFDFDTEEGRESFLAMLSSNKVDNCPPAPLSFYAINTEKDKDYSFGDTIIVPRSFPYYLAVACGLPICDIEFISSAANMKRRGTLNHQRYPFPSIDGSNEKKRGAKKTEKDCLVAGASNYTWEAPKKSRAAALERHSLWQKEEGPHAQSDTLLPGTDLLHGYTVLLLGEFDHPNHSKRAVAKRKKQRDSEAKAGGGYCTRGNITLLLQLCGATIYDIDSVVASKHIKKCLNEQELLDIKNAMPVGSTEENGTTLESALQSFVEDSSQSKMIIMVKDKSDAKLGSDFLNQLLSPSKEDEVSQITVVSCEWVLDSIGEFEPQVPGKYKVVG